MAKKETLTFKETMVEGDYLRTLTKDQKKSTRKNQWKKKEKLYMSLIRRSLNRLIMKITKLSVGLKNTKFGVGL